MELKGFEALLCSYTEGETGFQKVVSYHGSYLINKAVVNRATPLGPTSSLVQSSLPRFCRVDPVKIHSWGLHHAHLF